MPRRPIDILMPARLLSYAEKGIDERFVLHRMWAADDREAFLAEAGPKIRGLATFGGTKIDAAYLDQLPALEIVSTMSVGYDAIDVAECGRRGIYVTHAPGVLTEEVADVALGLLLMTVREMPAAERYLRAGRWQSEGPFPITRGSLKGRKVGILGLGRIGQAVAKRCEAFNLEIHYHNRRPVADSAYTYHATLKGMAETVDTLIVVAPGGAETRHLINGEILSALGPMGILINIGRGSIVDEAALVQALESGTILGAGLDVFEDEPRVHPGLVSRDDVVLLPHVASGSIPTREDMAQLMIDNLTLWFDEGRLVTPVPETPYPDTHALAERGGG
jgi:lactate dehydrogenase-like 2-hydroxyacid dehydrogenase